MKILAIQYRESLSALNQRIKELTGLKVTFPLQVDELNDRIHQLELLKKDLAEVTKVVVHYYEGGYWRDETLTLNQRKSRKYIYVEPIYD